MNLGLLLSSAVLVILLVAIGNEVVHARRRARTRRRRALTKPKRVWALEKRMASAFAGPREHHGDCFAEFSIWRLPDSTRMDVKTRGTWPTLSEFTRVLIVRHLWRSLKAFVNGAVVVCVDPGTSRSMVWTAAQNEHFNDVDGVSAWMPPRTARVGTLISGR